MRAAALAAIYLLDNISWFLTKPGYNLTHSFMAPSERDTLKANNAFAII